MSLYYFSPLLATGNLLDPLIDKLAQRIVYVGIILLIASILVVLGLISKRVDEAIIFALVLSGILIALVFIL